MQWLHLVLACILGSVVKMASESFKSAAAWVCVHGTVSDGRVLYNPWWRLPLLLVLHNFITGKMCPCSLCVSLPSPHPAVWGRLLPLQPRYWRRWWGDMFGLKIYVNVEMFHGWSSRVNINFQWGKPYHVTVFDVWTSLSLSLQSYDCKLVQHLMWLFFSSVVSALNKAWCVNCFACSTCNTKLTLK